MQSSAFHPSATRPGHPRVARGRTTAVGRGRGPAWLAACVCLLAFAATVAAAATPTLRTGATGVGAGMPPGPRMLGFTGGALYDNTGNPANDYYVGQSGAEAVDDLHLVAGGTLDVVEFEYFEPAAGPLSATVRIYSNPGGTDSDLIPLAGPYEVSGLTGGRGLASLPLPAAVAVGADLWVGVQFSSTTAGLITHDVPSVGTSHDLYFENGNIFWFGGNPKANFGIRLIDLANYSLGVSVIGQGTVAKDPDQAQYLAGAIVQLSATPETHWHFAGWSGGASGTSSPVDVTMDSDKSVTATFAIDTYALNVSVAGQGTVARSPDLAAYDHGTVVRLTPAPATGWHFIGWGGDATGAADPLDVTMDAPRSVTATFAIDTYALSVTTVGQGTVSKNPDQAAYDYGTLVQLSASPATGWQFIGWSGDVTGIASSVDVTINGPRAVTATFAINTYVVDVNIVGQGTVTRTPDQALYDHGSVVRLTAAPAAGWHFTGWSGDATGAVNPLDVTVTAPRAITATFVINTYALTVTTVGPGSVTKSPDQALYDHGTVVHLTAVPGVGIPFLGWSGDVTSLANPIDVTMNGPRSVTALFAANLVGNGSFEVNTSGWNTYGNAGLVRVSGGQDGTWAAKITGPSPGVEEFGLNDSPSWVANTGPAGTRFDISAYIRSATSVSPIRMRIREYKNQVRVGDRVYSASVPLTSAWQKISMQYVTLASGTYLDFQILNMARIPGEVFLIDNVVILNLGPGPSAPLVLQNPTASSQLSAGSSCLVSWVPPAVPVDSTRVSATTDDGNSWSVVGCAQGVNTLVWHLPSAPTPAALFLQSFANGVVVSDAISDPLIITAPVAGVDDGAGVPRAAFLATPRPSPVRTHTTVGFGLPRAANVRIRVLDLQGRVVATLAEGAFAAGRHEAVWDAAGMGGAPGAGIYFVHMDALGQSLVRKIAVTR